MSQQTATVYKPLTDSPELPSALFMPDLPVEQLNRLRAEKLIHSVGQSALGTELQVEKVLPVTNLLEAIESAKTGDIEALKIIRENVRTDVIERMIKAGFVMSVELSVNEQGQIIQHGQSAEQIQLNTLNYANDNDKMKPRTFAETRNVYRIENANRQGLLDDNYVLVLSRCSDNMTPAELREAGFFTETMSFAVQSTGKNKGVMTTESAFVAGTHDLGSARFDKDLVVKLYALLGHDISGYDDAETIDAPLLVPKHLMPNGAVDIVAMLDQLNEGTFFGLDMPHQDYTAFKAECERRQAELEPVVQKIVSALLAERTSLKMPTDATAALDRLSAKYCLGHAVSDERIDSRVFGSEAVPYVERARYYQQIGDYNNLSKSLNGAIARETSSSCPSGTKSSKDSLDNKLHNDPDEALIDTDEDTEKLEDCEFLSKECPKCHKKDVWTVCKDGKFYGDCGCKS
ncbi:MAG: hypothetical protein M3Q70_00930 [bacterium]|nr:hypothetical protein [bacterium]